MTLSALNQISIISLQIKREMFEIVENIKENQLIAPKKKNGHVEPSAFRQSPGTANVRPDRCAAATENSFLFGIGFVLSVSDV